MRFRFPHLTTVAKTQLWGMLVGFALALLATERMRLSYGLFFIGFAASWMLGEKLLAARLTGRSDAATLAIGIASGFAFPWGGFALALIAELARP